MGWPGSSLAFGISDGHGETDKAISVNLQSLGNADARAHCVVGKEGSRAASERLDPCDEKKQGQLPIRETVWCYDGAAEGGRTRMEDPEPACVPCGSRTCRIDEIEEPWQLRTKLRALGRKDDAAERDSADNFVVRPRIEGGPDARMKSGAGRCLVQGWRARC